MDLAALGLAQVDREGNVNVSRYANKLSGVGGFVNITQAASTVVFCGTFTTAGLEVQSSNGHLSILREGTVCKFREQVEQVSFSAANARGKDQRVLYVTERAVFGLGHTGLELLEIAPGIDLERDILGQMDFRPVMGEVSIMPGHLFEDGRKSL